MLLDSVLDLTWLTVCAAHVLLSPYTKVEESFNLQAVHDILTYGVLPEGLLQFDHVQFPGAVPRTFIGALSLAWLSYPVALLGKAAGRVQNSADVQVVVRLTLATLFALTLMRFSYLVLPNERSSFRGIATPRRLFLILCSTQFHLAFWGGRTTPNGIAMPITLWALGDIFSARRSGHVLRGIALLTFAASTLRMELVCLLAPAALWCLFTSRASFLGLLLTGSAAGFASAATSVLVDSYFWHRPLTNPLWPELHGILFNVVDGKSAEWGVSPFHSYFSSMLPKLLAFSLPFVPFGVFASRRSPRAGHAVTLLLISTAHVALLSFLGHKEWRFIVYTVPCFNVLAAQGMASVLGRARSTSPFTKALLRLAVLGSIALTAAMTLVSAVASNRNYPGGHALRELHHVVGDSAARVHISVLPAMTGVSLFQSTRLWRPPGAFGWRALPSPFPPPTGPHWQYSKAEDLPIAGPHAAESWAEFTHVLTDRADCAMLEDSSEQPFVPLTDPIKAFAGMRRRSVRSAVEGLKRLVTTRSMEREELLGALPVTLRMEPSVWLCARSPR